ncbi:MAG: hypothetical protein LIO80_00890 [Lachnospiraceae bacterium]|nr:hypothetical protein [Lachnospiraceae bacterium]
MKKRSLLRRGVGLVLAGSLVFGMQSIAFATDPELTESAQSDDTDVTGEVEATSGVSPTYIITIPEKIDFGTLTAPDTDEDDYKAVSFDVTASSFTNFSDNTGVAVLVKDSEDEKDSNGDWSAEFYIRNASAYSLEYSILDPSGDDISGGDLTYESGLLYHVFGAAAVATSSTGSVTVTGTAQLNQRQLYGYDLEDADSDRTGTYDGTLNFYAKVVSLSDYTS